MSEDDQRQDRGETSRPAPHGAETSRPAPHSAEITRPSPQYGQYATPEEQRARIRQPDATVALESGVSPAETAPAAVRRAPTPAAVQNPQAKLPSAADRIVTVGLLVFGLFNVILTAFSLVDFPTVASLSMQTMGVPGEFTNLAQGRLLGGIAAVALVVGWVITALFSWRRLRAGRITWWVPLVGAVVTYLVVYALLIPAILGDPAFMQYVTSTAS